MFQWRCVRSSAVFVLVWVFCECGNAFFEGEKRRKFVQTQAKTLISLNFLVLEGIISIEKLWKLFYLFIHCAVVSSLISKWKFVEIIDGVPRIFTSPSEKNIVNFLEMEFSSAEWKFQRTFSTKNKSKKVKISARAWKSVKREKCRGIEMHLIRDFLWIFWKSWTKKINQLAKKKS